MLNPVALSKINWTQIVAAVAMLLTVFGFELSTETQLAIVAGIGFVSQVMTVIFRSFFTIKG